MYSAGLGGAQGLPWPPAPQTDQVPPPAQGFGGLDHALLFWAQSPPCPPPIWLQRGPGARRSCQRPQAGGEAPILQKADGGAPELPRVQAPDTHHPPKPRGGGEPNFLPSLQANDTFC